MISIGIDLGTTYSCVATVENEQPNVIPTDDGTTTLPSIVAFCDKEVVVGNTALYCNTDPSNIVYDSKRLIGLNVLNDLPIAKDCQLWSYNADIRNNCAGYILNKNKYNEKFVTAEEVSSEILKRLKYQAEKYASKNVKEAVVTIPAMFQEEQIAATKRAIELAGFNLKNFLQEPIAAAIAYNWKHNLGNSKLLVFDFGGGTLDISVVEIKNGEYLVMAITGDCHLGGQDFDSRIMKFVIDEFKKSFPNYDIYERSRLLKRLRIECRKAKESLSSSQYPVNVHLEINDNKEVNVILTHEKFVELSKDLITKALSFVDEALSSAKLTTNQIDYVILVGGSSKIQLIQQNLEKKFSKEKLKFDINPNEAIAIGAAIDAANSTTVRIRSVLYKTTKNIGIDLGTTYSCVAVIENGRPMVIHNTDGRNTLPSVVAFSDDEILVGNPALDCNTDMANILYDSRRLIGWHVLNNLPIAEDRQLWTFNAVTKNNCAGYILNKGARNERFIRPEEVSAEILKSLKRQTEMWTYQKMAKAVVTIPAWFTDSQKIATKKAAELARIELKCLLPEPIAAAIAYNEKKKLGNSKLLVFDLGGGTLNISVVEAKNSNFDIKAIAGDAHLGGQDFDSRIMKFVIGEFQKTSYYDIYRKPKLLKRLRNECRSGKEALSYINSDVIIRLDINDELEMNVRLTKEKFNELCSDLFDKAMRCVDRVLQIAQLGPSQIDYVILAGGSTRIPDIQQRLANKFGRNRLKFDINPDEVIAYGAAIAANI